MHTLAPIVGIVVVFICLKQWTIACRRRLLPPGPPGLPLVGNTFDWSLDKPWLTLSNWARTYGDMMYAKVAGHEFVVLSSVDVATALLHGKSAQYSDRPPLHFIGNMAGWAPMMALVSDGPELHEQRRMFAKGLGTPKAIEVFDSRIQKCVVQFVQRMVEDSDPDVVKLAHWLAGILILDVTYGYQISNANGDEIVTLATQVLQDWSNGAAAGARLVNTLPWLERLPAWLPGMGFRHEAEAIRARWIKFSHWPIEFAKDRQRKGTAIPSMVNANLEGKDLTPEKELSLKWSAAAMYAGGSDTAAATISYFILYMVQHPEVQERAQAELDALLGGARLPTARDMGALPYVGALISEVLRLGTITPQAFPHQARETDTWEGFLIPKGALMIPNLYFMSRDPRNYKNPDVFNPDRFLGANPELDPRKYVFGFGRRICPGRMFADIKIFLAITTCLSTVTFMRAKDNDGNEIVPKGDWGGLTITCPDHFPCRVVPRSEQSMALLQETGSQVLLDGANDGPQTP